MATHMTSEDTADRPMSRRWSSPGSPRATPASPRSPMFPSRSCPGEIHALLGENGAGKSTLMGVASGETAARRRDDHRFARRRPRPLLTPKLANSLGIAIVHQHPALLPDMTVAENILLAVPPERLGFAGDARERSMRALLDEVGLECPPQRPRQSTSASPASTSWRSPRRWRSPRGADPRRADRARSARSRSTCSSSTSARPPPKEPRSSTSPIGWPRCALLADRVTVLRDGKVSGTANVDEVSDDQLLA